MAAYEIRDEIDGDDKLVLKQTWGCQRGLVFEIPDINPTAAMRRGSIVNLMEQGL